MMVSLECCQALAKTRADLMKIDDYVNMRGVTSSKEQEKMKKKHESLKEKVERYFKNSFKHIYIFFPILSLEKQQDELRATWMISINRSNNEGMNRIQAFCANELQRIGRIACYLRDLACESMKRKMSSYDGK